MRRHLRVLLVQLRASLALTMQYRLHFLLSLAITLVWLLVSVMPLWVMCGPRGTIAGWRFDEALLVFAWFMLLKAMLEGAINPSLVAAVEHVRMGTLDFLLVMPADAQLLVSTTRFEPVRLVNGVAGLAIGGYAAMHLRLSPSPGAIAAAAALTVAAVALAYSLGILVVSAAFWVVRVHNLINLLNAIFDAARWPATVFRGAWHVVFTFIVPLALMTTYPAEALLGRLAPATTAAALAGTAVFAVCARLTWTRALAHYTSASS